MPLVRGTNEHQEHIVSRKHPAVPQNLQLDLREAKEYCVIETQTILPGLLDP